jgi:hypothetical protein
MKDTIIAIGMWSLSLFFFYLAYDGLRSGVVLGGGIRKDSKRSTSPIRFWSDIGIVVIAGIFLIVLGVIFFFKKAQI